MQCNVSNTDKTVRYVIAAVSVIAGLTLTTGIVSIVLFALAGIMVVTSLISWCPIYRALGISTCDASAKTDPSNA